MNNEDIIKKIFDEAPNGTFVYADKIKPLIRKAIKLKDDEFSEWLKSWLSIFFKIKGCKFCEAHELKIEEKIKELGEKR